MHTTPTLPAADTGRVFHLHGRPVDPGTRDGQATLLEAWKGRLHPVCPCTRDGVAMSLALTGDRVIVKRMPGTAGRHAPTCPSHHDDTPNTAPGGVPGPARTDPATGRITVRLAFSLTRPDPRSTRGSVPLRWGMPPRNLPGSAGAGLGLHGLLGYLWDEAGLTWWSPRMEGKRTWGVISTRLRRALEPIDVDGHPLAARVWIPEPFRAHQRSDIARRRAHAWEQFRPRDGRPAPVMILIGELNDFAPARWGHQVVIRHLPDQPLYVDTATGERLAEEHRGLTPAGGESPAHVLVAATITLTAAGSARAHQIVLQPVTRCWIPYDDPDTRALADHLAASQRRFRMITTGQDQPGSVRHVAILTDTDPPTLLTVTGRRGSPDGAATGGETGLTTLTWCSGSTPPPLPPALAR